MTPQWTDAGLARLLNDVKKESGMEQIKDGGPAFPMAASECAGHGSWWGMTLRDYFAAKAMQGFASGAEGLGRANDDLIREQFSFVARLAYVMADAMLAAREGKS